MEFIFRVADRAWPDCSSTAGISSTVAMDVRCANSRQPWMRDRS